MSNSDYKMFKGYPDEVKAQIIELSEDYDCPIPTIVALYEIMPDELYDGIPASLEDDWPCIQRRCEMM